MVRDTGFVEHDVVLLEGRGRASWYFVRVIARARYTLWTFIKTRLRDDHCP